MCWLRTWTWQSCDCAERRRRYEERVLGHDAVGEAWRRRLPVGQSLLNLPGGQFDAERAIGNVEDDGVTIGDCCDGAAARSLGSDVARHESVGSAAETAIGEQSDGIA